MPQLCVYRDVTSDRGPHQNMEPVKVIGLCTDPSCVTQCIANWWCGEGSKSLMYCVWVRIGVTWLTIKGLVEDVVRLSCHNLGLPVAP